MVSTHPKLGDVFVVPIDDDRAGVGQVVGTYLDNCYYFAIFGDTVPSSPAATAVADALQSDILLLALSQDAKLHAGHWTVVGEAVVDPRISLPDYKIAVDQGGGIQFEVQDASGRLRRHASDFDITQLPYRKVVAPVRLERALRAAHRLEPWLDHYGELREAGLFARPMG